MNPATSQPDALLMIAYTNYRTDPRVIREAEAAVSAGFVVDVISLRGAGDPDQEKINGVRVFHLDQARYRGSGIHRYLLSYSEFFIRCFIKTTRLQLNRRYRIVHVHNMPDFFVFCAVLPKVMSAKVLLDIHDPMPETFLSKLGAEKTDFLYKLLLWQERASARFADEVLTVSHPVKESILVKEHRLPACSVHVIANFADDELFSLQDVRRFDSGLRLIFHGTILERYGLQDVLRALSNVGRKDRIRFKIIGDGDYSGHLKDMIFSLGLGQVVDFENRLYPVEEMPKILSNYNLGLVPMVVSSITNYALPLKLLEYLSLGMTSITVRNLAVGYYFGENDLIYYEPGNPDSLCRILDNLVENPDILNSYQDRARVLRDNFLWSKEKQKYISLLHRLWPKSV